MRSGVAAIAFLTVCGLIGWIGSARAQALTIEAVNQATFPPSGAPGKKPPAKGKTPAAGAAMLKAQILLDRARFSPGVIDGQDGENVRKALAAFEGERGLNADGQLDPETWVKLTETSSDPVLVEYTITKDDVDGPFEKKIPDQFEAMAELSRLPYTGPAEHLAEKFHVTEELLKALNPKKPLDAAGTKILVPNVLDVADKDPAAAKALRKEAKGLVGRIEVQKNARALKAFDKEGKLVAFYPASIGSDEKPAPSGEHTVRAIAENPTYTYNPDYKFKGVKADKKLTIKPGPNNPVGAVWIDLSVESFGIHGTPEPRKVGKSYSHGCVRLTNWDVKELARMVEKGTTVTFLD
jgi:lipoprotein-anchoring transpeptidase ErfK/SrfK